MSLAFATGLVLPFGGPGGNAVSLALSQSLQTASPIVAELAFPETPWPQGWSVVMGDPDGPGGARIAAEATGADWVLVGKVGGDGWISAYLFKDGRALPARFSNPGLLASWAALQLGKKPAPLDFYPELDKPLADLMESAPHFDAEPYLQNLAPKAAKVLERQVSLVTTLYGHGAAAAKTLPTAVLDFWKHRQNPEEMTDAGVGPVWKAFYPIMNDDQKTAVARAKALLGSRRALDVAGAMLLLRSANDPTWRQAAARLTTVAPELVLGWEELSFAAFEQNDATLAQKALLKAIELDPQKSLYWTNLGWADYLLGEIYQAIYASRRGLDLEENPVAAYNLGLFHALLGDYGDAFGYYRQALRLDDGSEVQAALGDLKNTRKDAMLFWRGYLLARSGRWREARRAYAEFLQRLPNHRLADEAKAELEALQDVKNKLAVTGYKLGPLEVQPPFGVDEEVRPLLTASSNAYLPSGKVTVRVLAGDKVVAQSITNLTVPPLTSGFTRELEPFTVHEPGEYELTVEYAGARTQAKITVGPTNLARQLLSRGLVPTDLDGNPLLPDEDLAGPEGEKKLIAVTLSRVRSAAAQAAKIERFTKPLAHGPYKGKSVAQLMAAADAKMVERFYQDVLHDPEMLDEDAVNAFAHWLERVR